jgi:LacI family transcriptional regulator
MEKTPTISDVARLAGVSVATASRTLTRARRVDPRLQARVLAAVYELSYAPNPHARALAQATDASVGVVVHDISDPYFSEIVSGMLGAAADSDRLVVFCNTYRDPERELAYVRHFRAQRVQALVLAGSGREDREFGAAMAEQILGFGATGGRAVLIGRHYAPGDAVLPDNFGGARALAAALAEMGHRLIGVISGPPQLTTTFDRLAGFRRGLEEAGIELMPGAIIAGDFSRQSGERAVHALLDAVPGLTAIFASNDVMALGALRALRGRGLRVPDDVSIAGFDDIPIASDLWPPLTTVRVPMARMGELALRMVVEPSRGSALRVEHLPTELVLRASTGRPPTLSRGA